MIDLDSDQLEDIRRILEKLVPDHNVIAFGSRVTGTARQYSDLDLVLISREQVGSSVMADLKEAFSESDLPIAVDILDWQILSDSFRQVIIRSPHITLRKSDETIAEVISS